MNLELWACSHYKCVRASLWQGSREHLYSALCPTRDPLPSPTIIHLSNVAFGSKEGGERKMGR